MQYGNGDQFYLGKSRGYGPRLSDTANRENMIGSL